MTVKQTLIELKKALSADRVAKAVALRRGQTMEWPLSDSRLGDLCQLGERMIRAEKRKDRALVRLQQELASPDNGSG